MRRMNMLNKWKMNKNKNAENDENAENAKIDENDGHE